MSNYRDPVIAQYIALIKENCDGAIRHFYEGEPVAVPTSNLPCLVISKQETRVGVLNNAEDQHGMAMTMTLIADIRKDLSTQEDRDKVAAGVSTLYELIEGRNKNLTLRDNSILGILRGNILVNETYGLRTDLGSITRVDYGQTLRDRSKEAWTIEAQVDFVAHFAQAR